MIENGLRARIDARYLAKAGAQAECGAGRLPVDYDRLLAHTPFDPKAEQATAAIAYGNVFERRCADDAHSYARVLVALEEAGLIVGDVAVEDLGLLDDHTIEDLAEETHRLLGGMLHGDIPTVLIAQAVLRFEFAGTTVYLKPDALTIVPITVDSYGEVVAEGTPGGRVELVPVEIKGFRVRPARYPDRKMAGALEQVGTYQLALRREAVALGFLADVVSDRAVIINALKLGMAPVASVHDNRAVRLTLERRITATEARLQAAHLDDPNGAFAAAVALDPKKATAKDRLAVMAALVDTYGHQYSPECLAHCGAAKWCREQAADEPGRLGNLRSVQFAGSIQRARRFAWGVEAAPSPEFEPLVAELGDARRLVQAACAQAGLVPLAPPPSGANGKAALTTKSPAVGRGSASKRPVPNRRGRAAVARNG